MAEDKRDDKQEEQQKEEQKKEPADQMFGSSIAPPRDTGFKSALDEREGSKSYQAGTGGKMRSPTQIPSDPEAFRGAPSVAAGQQPRSGNPQYDYGTDVPTDLKGSAADEREKAETAGKDEEKGFSRKR